MSSQTQIAGLAAQVNELTEINKTLKTYLEGVYTKVAPEDARRLIESESERLKEAKNVEALKKNLLIEYLLLHYSVRLDTIIKSASEAASLGEFLKKLSTPEEDFYESHKKYLGDEEFISAANHMRESLGLPPFPPP
jgi:hypothetical protein